MFSPGPTSFAAVTYNKITTSYSDLKMNNFGTCNYFFSRKVNKISPVYSISLIIYLIRQDKKRKCILEENIVKVFFSKVFTEDATFKLMLRCTGTKEDSG